MTGQSTDLRGYISSLNDLCALVAPRISEHTRGVVVDLIGEMYEALDRGDLPELVRLAELIERTVAEDLCRGHA
jgi:hypothetical protein